MKTLLILRHAKSSWDNPHLTDHDRPLNVRGKRDAPRIGRLLREIPLIPDLILSSTAKRARRTADLVAEHCGYTRAIELRDELYHADVESCIGALGDVYYDDGCVMLIGHNPGLNELLYALTGVDDHLPTAALAQVSLPIETWPAISVAVEGTLANLWKPKELD